MSNLNRVSISGTFPVSSTIPPSYFLTDFSALKIKFVVSSATPFVSAVFGILKANGINIFVGLFTLTSGTEVTVIQIPLIGQSINDLVQKLNTYPGVIAESANSLNFVSSSLLIDTSFLNGTNKWVYFDSSSQSMNPIYSTLRNSIKFYRTTPEPISIQRNFGQCLGGFVSTNTLYNYASLSSPLSIYDNVINIDPLTFSDSLTLNRLNQSPYLQINDEIVRVNKWSGYTVYLLERNSFGTPLRFHPQNSLIKDLNKNDLFDSTLGEDGKQYRCIAIKNTNQTEIAKNLKVFFELPSRNNLSGMRLAIEAPKSDYYADSVLAGGITAFTVANLVGLFGQEHFVSAPIVFTSGSNKGQSRIVQSYNPTSGTIVIDTRLANPIVAGDTFYIDTSPCQRIKSGTKAPTTPAASAFFVAEGKDNAVSINVSANRLSGNDLYPNEVIYIWIERSISESNDQFLNNRAIVNLIYSKV